MPSHHLNGVEVWFGTSDAPAPSGLEKEAAPEITVGTSLDVQDAAITVHYRRTGGPWQRLMLRLRTTTTEAFFFKGRFPELPVGTRIEYQVYMRCGGARPRSECQVGDTNWFEVEQRQGETKEAFGKFTRETRLSATAPTMDLNTSPLFIGMQNDQVHRLHEVLILLGSDIPAAELRDVSFGDGTRQAVVQFQGSQGLPATGIVDANTMSRLPHVVRGQVRRPDGAPLAGLIVRAFDRNLRQDDTLLGEPATTSENGEYRIQYRTDELGKETADLVARVEADGGGEPLVASETIFRAGLVEIVDLTVSREEAVWSEYEKVRQRLEQALKRQGLSLTDVQAAEYKYLAGVTDLDVDRVGWLIASAHAEQKTGILAPAFYAFFRKNLPVELPALLRQDRQVLHSALVDALDNNIIPASLRHELDAILVERLSNVQAEELLKPADDARSASLGDLLATMPEPLSEAQKTTLATLLAAPPDGNVPFWETVGNSGISDVEIGRVQATLMLGTLTQNHKPLVSALQERFQLNSPAALRRLVELGQSGWHKLVAAAGVPPDIAGDTQEEQRKRYAKQLQRSIEELYPTASIAARLDVFPVAAEARPDLQTFFQKNPEFELGRDVVLAYFEEGGGAILDGIDPNNLPRLKEQLLPLERVTKISKRPKEASLLLQEGLDSSYKIVSLGRRDFLTTIADKLDGDIARAETIYANAEQNVAMALALLTRYSQTYNNIDLAVVPASGVATAPAPDPARGIADVRTLFGNQDFCSCEHCRSVYSPAAYLVDLLHYLAKRKLPNGTSLKGILLIRRPDLVEIELTCENTNTRTPYIDLANEVLENAVAPVLAGAPYPQTSWSEAELAANPEHLNTGAYNKLKDAAYPWTLPFNLWIEEARTYLDHLGVQRCQLMETLHPADRLTSYAIAQEYLGLTEAEARLIVVVNPTPAHLPDLRERWGFPSDQVQDFPDTRAGVKRSGLWSDLLKTVSMFLQQSGLAYADLLNLLQMRYITAKAAAGQPLNLTGEECNPGKMVLAGLNDDILARIPRFVRLWRRLGWPMHDLDRAIADFPGGEITDDFILWLSHILRLRGQLNVPIATVLSWWSKLDTFGSYIYFTKDDHPSIRSLYDQLFLNRTVVGALVGTLEVDQATGELKYLGGGAAVKTITNNKPAVLSGLSISVADLTLLLAATATVPDPADPTKMKIVPLVPDELRLDNLSKLYRIASLTRSLGLSIRDWLALTAITGSDPFPNTTVVPRRTDASAATWNFVENVAFIRTAGFSVAELNYLLRHQLSRTTAVAPTDEQIALILDDIRKGLWDIAGKTTVAPDDSGELLGKGLGLLEWPDHLIAEVLSASALSSSPRLEVALEVLPPNVIPAGLQAKISHDAQVQRLICLGALRQQERDGILAAPVNWTQQPYQSVKRAVEELYEQSKQVTKDRVDLVSARLQSFRLPAFFVDRLTTNLAALPAGLTLPDALPDELKGLLLYNAGQQKLQYMGLMTAAERDTLQKLPQADQAFKDAIERLYVVISFPRELADRFYYDRSARQLRFVGWMTETERRQLLTLTSVQSFRDAITELYDKTSRYQEPDAANQFLTKNDVERLFFDARSLPERFEIILRKLMPYVRERLSENLVVQQLAQALALEVQMTKDLLTQWLEWPDHTNQAGHVDRALAAFLDPAFAASSLNDRLTAAAFRDQFKTFIRLHKVALLLSKLQVRAEQRDWLFPNAKDVYGFNQLPLQPVQPEVPVTDGYERWRRLVELFQLRDSLPAGAVALGAIFVETDRQGATATSMRQEIDRLLNWNADDIRDATGRLQISFPDDYRDPVQLGRLKACFDLLKRLGVSADQAWEWAKPTLNDTHSTAIKQTVRARFDHDAWLERAQPLRDRLREKQRQALVEYLVSDPQMRKQNPTRRDANDLFGQYLIDVEMDPCMLTSRIKQAISSIQLFVQRCLMNLEKDAGVSPASIDVDRWNWMKNYRVWEANRKIFVYPENWIEPELRDDKSPFFAELESELLQGDITADKAEQAFRIYLQKLDEVARLEIVGMYHEKEGGGNDIPWISGPINATQTAPVIDVLHVFGRTYSMPHVYYYRRQVDASYWTAWERVDLDIEGEHLIPVVWKRRLYLFWPIFREKALEPNSVEPAQPPRKVSKVWEIQLAWSEYQNGRWSSKKISPNAPFQYPEEGFEEVDWGRVFARNKFFLKGLPDEDTVTVWCYGPAVA